MSDGVREKKITEGAWFGKPGLYLGGLFDQGLRIETMPGDTSVTRVIDAGLGPGAETPVVGVGAGPDVFAEIAYVQCTGGRLAVSVGARDAKAGRGGINELIFIGQWAEDFRQGSRPDETVQKSDFDFWFVHAIENMSISGALISLGGGCGRLPDETKAKVDRRFFDPAVAKP